MGGYGAALGRGRGTGETGKGGKEADNDER